MTSRATHDHKPAEFGKYDPDQDKLTLPEKESLLSLSPGSWADNLLKSNPEPRHDIGLMNYHQLSYGPGLGWAAEQSSFLEQST